MDNNEINNLFNNAVILYNAKNYRDAFTLCDAILKSDSNHTECNYIFGLLYMKSGNYDLSIKYLSFADRINPNNSMYLNSLGLAYSKKNNSEEAEKYFLKSIELKPKFIKPFLNLAKLHKKNNEFDKAEKTYRQALKLDPDSIIALNNLGNILLEKKDYEGSILCYDKILKNNPDKAEALVNKANVYEMQGENNLAKQYYLNVLKINPNFGLAHINLGKLYLKLNEFQNAIECFQNASKLEPNNAEYLIELSIAYYKSGDYNSTKHFCQKAQQLNPNVPNAALYLGTILHLKGFIEESLKFYLEELKISPESAEVHYAVGKAYFDLKNYEEALKYFDNSIQLNPDNSQAHYGLIRIRLELCDWTNRKKDESLFIKLLEKQVANNSRYFSLPIVSLNNFAIPLKLHIKTAKYFAKMYSTKIDTLRSKINFKYRNKNNSKIKIGYISPDFRNHAVGLLIRDLFQNHDKSKFEIYCYSLSPEMPDDNVQSTIKNGCNYFINLYNSSIESAAKKINEDEINILVDLAGFTGFAQTEILAMRPSPIQAQYLGYPNTMGAEYIDYMITDSTIITDELENSYTEKMIFLPQTFVYSPLEISRKSIKKSDFGLPEDGIVFCSFNSPTKIDPETYDIWMNILKKTPNSILWLSGANESIVKNLKREAESKSISAERIIFKKELAHKEYMAIHQLADLFLDTFLYNAGSTAVCSMAAGLPLLTYAGSTYSSRMSASILTSAGLPELICHSKKEFEEKAISLAQNPSVLKKIKEKLITNQKTELLFNIKNFAGYLEQAYSKIWGNYKNGNNPQSIIIDDSTKE
ncbi:MAG: tetratricopeptide repeat protein [Bacteroidetes bacterium]|nr:tetratricopeptide repeat protein [Bacteroidota bacterium]